MSTGTAARWRFVKASDLRNDTVGFDGLEVRSMSADEKLGSLKGFIVDGDSGQLHYVVVDSGGWFTGGSYLIPPAYTRVDAEQNVLWAETTRDAIGRFPEFDLGQYPTLSDEQLWGIERRIIEAYGDDPGVVAPSANWDRTSWSQYNQPEWWRRDYYDPLDSSADVAVLDADPDLGGRTAGAGRGGVLDTTVPNREAGILDRERERVVRPSDLDRERERSVRASETGRSPETGRTGGWPDPAVDRAQPGDVLGIERGGETTSLGDTGQDEDQRRDAAEKEIRESTAQEVRDRAADRPTDRRR